MSRGQRKAAGLDLSLPLVLILSAAAALPLLGPYFVGSHDGILAVYRFFQFDRSIQDGILMPRWAPDLFFGYGYPFFNFYAPLSYYVAEGFHTAGLGFVGSISATFALGFVLSGVFMYLFVRDLAGRWAGLLAALAYVFAPYHLVNAHLRGDLAEFFAFVWFPAILWAAGRLMSRGNLGYLALTSLFYGALLITHNIMALAFSALLAAYLVFLLVANKIGGLPHPATTLKINDFGGTPPIPPGLPAVNNEAGRQPQPHGLPVQNEVGGHTHIHALPTQERENEVGGYHQPHGLPAQGDETGGYSHIHALPTQERENEVGGYHHPHGLPAQGDEQGEYSHPHGLPTQGDEQGGSPLAHGLPAQGDETGSRSGAFGRQALYALAAIVLAFGLSAFFWMPALLQVDDIQIGRLANDPSFYYRTSLMQVSSYVSNALLQYYGPRSEAGDYAYPVELGLIEVVLAAAGLALLVIRRIRGDRSGFGPLAFLAVAALAYYAVMFPWALPLWEKVPLMSYLQSPWRLLPFLILFTSALTGYLGRWVSLLRPGRSGLALTALVLLVTIPNVVNLLPRYVDLREDQVSVLGSLRFELTSQNLGMTAAGEYLPKGVRSKLGSSPLALDAIASDQPPVAFDESFLAKGAKVEVLETRTTLGRFNVSSPEGTPFLFNQTYFPGWASYVDGQEAALMGVGTANLMSVQVPPGKHTVEFRFQDTRARLLGNAVSLVSAATLVLAWLVPLLRRPRSRQSATRHDQARPGTTSNNQAQPGTTKHHQAQPGTTKQHQALPVTGLLLVLLLLIAVYALQRQSALSPATVASPVEVSWSGGPTLIGYEIDRETLIPGEDTTLGLYWKDLSAQQEVLIGLKGRTGRVWSQSTTGSRGLGKEGAVQREERPIRVPADMPPGMYRITLDVMDNGKALLIQREGLVPPIFPEKSLLLGPVFVGHGAPVSEGPVKVATRREVNLENKAAFLGYDLALGQQSLELTTYWKALAIIREDYAVLAHSLDYGEKVLSYQDLQPEGNPYPTTLWRPGEVVTVPFHFDLPADFAPESYRIAIGLYTPDNFQRLSVIDAAGQPVTNTIFLTLAPATGQ